MSAAPASDVAPASEVAPAWESVLDRDAVKRLRELDPTGKAGLLGRVIGTYVTSLGKLRAQIDAGRAAGDAAQVKLAAHTLKSSSASVGALALSALCAEVEGALREPGAGLPASSARLDALAAEAARVHEALVKVSAGGQG